MNLRFDTSRPLVIVAGIVVGIGAVATYFVVNGVIDPAVGTVVATIVGAIVAMLVPKAE